MESDHHRRPCDAAPFLSAAAAEPAVTEPRPAVLPTRLTVRRDGWTAERQRLFLSALAESGNVAAAARAAGISARSAFRLRTHPQGEAFARAWDAALMTAAGGLLSMAFQRAIEGAPRRLVRNGRVVAEQREPSDRMLMFLLRHLHPDLFGHDGPAPKRQAAIGSLRQDYAGAMALLADSDVAADEEEAGPFIVETGPTP